MTTHRSDHDSRKSDPNESGRHDEGNARGAGTDDPRRHFRPGHRARHRGHRARKERVLHTRISEQLAEDIREFAEDLRVPASNLVRNVLEEVFTVVNSVSGDVGDLMDDLVQEAEGVRDRVRRQARSRHSSSRADHRSSRRSRRGYRPDPDSDHTDVEEELRRDEEREFRSTSRGTTAESAASESSESAPGRAGEPKARPSAAELFPKILGWQPLVLNRDFDCGRCECALRAGESAFLGIEGSGLTDVALCGRCASSPGRGGCGGG